MSRMAVGQIRRAGSLHGTEDAQLVASVSRGDMDAFAELYRRHAEHAWRVARRVTDDEDDARDAVADAFAKVLRMLRMETAPAHIHFRPYLLVAARHAAVDVLRRKARVSPTRDLETLDSPTGFDQASDRAVADEETRLVNQALSALPEREQLVLWLLEVEEKSLRTAAKALTLKPNHVAQIAMRARRRLRRSYVQAHLSNDVTGACRFTVEHLPAYLDEDLSQPTLVRIDEHLSGCSECEQRLEELRDLGLRMRRALLLPSLLGARSRKWWPRWGRSPARPRPTTHGPETVPADVAPAVATLPTGPPAPVTVANAFATVTGHIASPLGTAAPAVQHFVAAASATLLVLGLSALDGAPGPSAGPSPHRPPQGPVVAASEFESPGDLVVEQRPPDAIPGGPSEGAAVDSPNLDPPPPGSPPPVDPGRSGGVDPAHETPAGGDAPATAPAAPAPPADAGPGHSAGVDRAKETPAGSQAPAPAPGGEAAAAPARAGPGHATGLDRAQETPAGDHNLAPGGPAPPARAGPGHAQETPAGDHLP